MLPCFVKWQSGRNTWCTHIFGEKKNTKERDERNVGRPGGLCYGRWHSAIVAVCAASRSSLGMVWCYCDQTVRGRSTLAEVFNVVSILCVDIGVFNGAVRSKHAVNSTLVYFKLDAYCLPLSVQSQILTVWLDCCCFFFCLFVCLISPKRKRKEKKKKQADGQNCYTAFTRTQRCSSVHWCLDIFGILSSLSSESLRGSNENNAYNKTEKLLMN